MSLGIIDFVFICFVCVLTALLALKIAFQLGIARGGPKPRDKTSGVLRLVNGRIVECDPALMTRLEREGWHGDLSDLRPFFAFRFDDLPDDFPSLEADGSAVFTAGAPGDRAELTVVNKAHVISIVLRDPAAEDAMAHHVDLYRDHARQMGQWIVAEAPQPTWITDQSGRVRWANTAYHQLEKLIGNDAPDCQHIFYNGSDETSYVDRQQSREKLTPKDGGPDMWFDIRCSQNQGRILFQANDVTAVVKAENAQRAFVQTLTKTFAQLSTGLAIFDRNRHLALFNPALIDLTGIHAEFLSARPSHLTFFDKLRDEKIMPEPRNYGSWRDQIMEVITRAENAQYQETWTLPEGKTYRVTGRPHPNGAVAFLFDDVSAEVTLTRRFREQLDLSQAVMDSLDDALAVFSPQGVLSYTNEAYRELWTDGSDTTGAIQLDQKVAEVSRLWQVLCGPDPTWGDFRDFVVGFGDRCEWDSRVRMRDGRTLDCRFKPLQGGATLASFRVAAIGALREIQSH
ncbi:PAS-domain containing protein [Pseudooceanicola sp. MF1-13]|uniref:PAS-domain containing protein n=1 Tax=Pseudooceanicola sp. MF1-13 TaxID=3379095 RepID=UPI0038919511